MLDEFIHGSRVAYFSMEIALRNEIPTYAGGLGVLAGDTVRSAVDLMIPIVAVSLISRAGYFHQQIDVQGRQVEQAIFWEPERWTRALDAKVAVPIEGRTVWVGAWLHVVEGHMGGRQPVLLLDTDLNENHPDDREITHYLYGGDMTYRLKQEIVLGIGGVRMLQALGVNVRRYHMNEGHSALLGLELMRRYTYQIEDVRPGEARYDLPRVRDLCSFTTHTPIEAGHDRFPYDLVQRVLDSDFDIEGIKHLAGEDNLNMTRLALNLSEYVNGVAKKHAEVSKVMFPGYRVHAITNGVHPFIWTSESFRQLYNHYLSGWCHEPQLLMRADCCIPDAAIWESHVQAKQYLIEKVQALTGVSLDPKLPIIGFARRMTAYKRPGLLFSDIERLKTIALQHPFQVVFAGKAHAHDENGKHLIEQLYADARDLAGTITVIYLPDYNIELAQVLTAGVDVWLNTPLPPLEASGTSGMKAALNGVPSLSVLDGWWIEGCIEGVTGWAIGDVAGIADNDGGELYDKLEQVVLPLYYNNDRSNWIKVMKGAISKNASYFNSHRMMHRYVMEAYNR
jgi:starch phosphorylase